MKTEGVAVVEAVCWKAGWPRPTSRNLAKRHRAAAAASPAAMTLIEVLLVLILLVVLGSLSAPILEGTLENYRLQRGTDQILADWAKVRTRAIEDGQVYQFRFSQNSNQYRVDRWYADESYQAKQDSRSDDDLAKTDDIPDPQEDSDEDQWHLEASLSGSVEFTGGQQAGSDTDGKREVTTLEGEGSDDWSAPILFFPDGTTSEASVLLRNKLDRYQRVTLRALTGSARGSQLLTAKDVEQQESR